MKNIIKYIIGTSVALSVFVVSQVDGAVVSSQFPTGAGTNIVNMYTGPFTLQSLIAVNPTTVTLAVTVFDSPNLGTTNVTPAFTNYTTSVVSVTNIYTNIFGSLNTNIYSTITNTIAAVAQTTNNYRVLDSFSVPAGTTLTRTYPAGSVFGAMGLVVTNTLTNFTYTAILQEYK